MYDIRMYSRRNPKFSSYENLSLIINLVNNYIPCYQLSGNSSCKSIQDIFHMSMKLLPLFATSPCTHMTSLLSKMMELLTGAVHMSSCTNKQFLQLRLQNYFLVSKVNYKIMPQTTTTTTTTSSQQKMPPASSATQ